ncbi:MAG: tRNA-binding protein [Flavobacteriaceae bacterium]|nr:tRNA-binding protein [Flavobacteriaceae bacterium]MBT4112387.1 tRNA-binding protein [Flavobacteriaceae bacterium]MBT4614241.1 tRNA-binding protein [Flavobacteriaceae bacterium]MBT5246694.1 tRNA-binding protein [Flavobacteriaceae bacterium]MBT5649879.1 tRNA-binding protein [Flavobacteriaceae bacterium]
MDKVTFEDFSKIDFRVGTIIAVEAFTEAIKPAYKLKIDFGDLGVLNSSAQITYRYSENDLLNRQVIAVVNFPKKQIANFMSECLVLGAVNENDVILISPDDAVKNGLKIH